MVVLKKRVKGSKGLKRKKRWGRKNGKDGFGAGEAEVSLRD